ncbi:MAG TPA: hypothetical protein VG164_13755 [Trebonia sp.]|nr:hypothetical protein [Trebonia sp.]
MLDWLATEEPALARIETGNAAVNNHMIAGASSLASGWSIPGGRSTCCRCGRCSARPGGA